MTGDGDTASIGIGHYIHMLRRNVPLIYVIENNGVYGLTKGQFSATAGLGLAREGRSLNASKPIDCCLAGIELGATLVARSFSGDKRQLSAILKACVAHRGLAIVDVISPCTTFNDHEGSTKSYSYMKDHEEPLHELDFVPPREEIEIELEEGTSQEVMLHDGSRLRLRKIGRDYDPRDRLNAIRTLGSTSERGEVLTGILYVVTGDTSLTENSTWEMSHWRPFPSRKCVRREKLCKSVMEQLR